MGSVDLFSLQDKVIVVTGGTGVLGGAFVKGIADAGGIPVILGRNAEVGAKRAGEINAAGGKAFFVVADVLEEDSLIKARERILE
ncbi:MAG: short-chain dehydrogenase/reductase, partial [Sediminibacterium sp.]|nr:short-chain dehydrogenase/reductase [Sediminibacterium sp.]